MATANAHAAHDHQGGTPVSQAVAGFLNYVKMLSEAFSEGLQQAHEARHKHPFADV